MAGFREFNNLAELPTRKAPKVELTVTASRWLQQLPQELQPRETAARFPHVANRLALLWDTPQACRLYFDELLLDHRGDRQGFPNRVARELVALMYHYDKVTHPASPATCAESTWRNLG